MSEYVHIEDALPEMEYVRPKQKRSCFRCGNSCVTNPGAVLPGLECTIAVLLFRMKEIENGNPQVTTAKHFATCRFFDMTQKAVLECLTEMKP